ncbi:MAG: phage integrase N-terminal SAM-like domain-containing protein [Vicinamibacterales bacterium]
MIAASCATTRRRISVNSCGLNPSFHASATGANQNFAWYVTTTRASYLRIIQAFHRHAGGRLDRLGPDDLRRYQIYLLEERKLAVGTVIAEIAALRFFYLRVLKRRDMKEDLPYPKGRRRLPVVLSPAEVQRLIASAKNLYHRTLLLTLYSS